MESIPGVFPTPQSATGLKYETASLTEVAQLLALAEAGVVLSLTVGVGIGAHELSHATVLSLFGIQCDIAIGPDRVRTYQFDSTVPGALAAVTPREIAPETTSLAVRLSAVAPLLLAVPFVAIAAGIVPDPLQADNPLLSAVTIGWLACAIPSPQDFGVFWHAERAITEHAADASPK